MTILGYYNLFYAKKKEKSRNIYRIEKKTGYLKSLIHFVKRLAEIMQ